MRRPRPPPGRPELAGLPTGGGNGLVGFHVVVALTTLWIVVALALFMYLVAQFIANPDDPSAINIGILVGSDHSVYIGVITNSVSPSWRCSSGREPALRSSARSCSGA